MSPPFIVRYSQKALPLQGFLLCPFLTYWYNNIIMSDTVNLPTEPTGDRGAWESS